MCGKTGREKSSALKTRPPLTFFHLHQAVSWWERGRAWDFYLAHRLEKYSKNSVFSHLLKDYGINSGFRLIRLIFRLTGFKWAMWQASTMLGSREKCRLKIQGQVGKKKAVKHEFPKQILDQKNSKEQFEKNVQSLRLEFFLWLTKKKGNWPDNWSAKRLTKTTWMLLLFHERGLHMCFHCFSWLIFLTSSPMCMNTIYIRYLLPKHIFLGVPPNILKFPTGLLKKARGTRVVETIFPLPKCRVSFFMYNCFHKSGYKS